MKQKKVATNDFDLEGFTNAVLSFLGGEVSPDVHPSYAIVKVDAPGGVPEFGPEEGRSNFMEEFELAIFYFFRSLLPTLENQFDALTAKAANLMMTPILSLVMLIALDFSFSLRRGSFISTQPFMQAGLVLHHRHQSTSRIVMFSMLEWRHSLIGLSSGEN